MEDQDIIKEFLIESSENLLRLDREMVELEQRPKDSALLASIFRTIHTIKGTCGFLGFQNLERITHIGENLLSQLRNGERELNPHLVSLILEMVDAIRLELNAIEATGKESGNLHESLVARLQQACDDAKEPQAARTPAPSAEGAGVEKTPVEKPPVQTPTAEKPPSVEKSTAPAAAEADPNANRGVSIAESTIRVDVGLLDRLMNLVGELVLARNQILQYSSRVEDASLNAASQRLNLITTQLQEGVMKTRMQPIGVVWNKLPRVVRDLAASCGKQIQLEMDGAETELDKSIIEAIKDPLTHLVRNCCDHGIEGPEARQKAGKPAQGRLSLRAFHEGGQVNIEIADDGAGIDPARIKAIAVQKGIIRQEQADRMSEREAVNLIFKPGFSTAEKVTNISGRGVGMDVVKTNIEKIGGTVDLVSRVGQGTTVKIKIPLTLAIIPGLVVMSGGERFVIPQVSLLELVRLEGEAARKLIERIHGTPVYRRRGNLLPIAYLNEVLRLGVGTDKADAVNIVILQAEERQFGLVVDGIHDTQEIVVKPLGKQLKGLTCYAGATIMGDGKVALILDVVGIGLRSGVLAESREAARTEASRDGAADYEKQTLLLFRSGRFERLAVPLSLVARLEEFPKTKLERASGQRVVQYRGQILPLIPLSSYLDPGAEDASERQDPVPVIVFSDGDRRIGVVVDQIVDIVEDAVAAKQPSGRKGLLGSGVVGQKVTDFLDLQAILEGSGGAWLSGPSSGARPKVRVLVADSSIFARGLVRHSLEMAGYQVVEAASVQEALEKLERTPVQIAAAALDLAGGGAAALVEAVRKQPALARIPVLALRADTDAADSHMLGRLFDEHSGKFDRARMLESIARLAAALGAQAAADAPLCETADSLRGV